MNYSGFWRRFLAYMIDGLILSIPGLVLGGSFGMGAGYGLHLVLGFLYYPFFECSVMSATPGKALLGIAVLTEAGERITFKAAVVRYFARYLSIFILMIGYFMQLFTTKRQTLHDMISETVVTNKESADLNYFTVWKNQFKEIFDKL
ncbi:MAG: RDD family protein [Bdellovibrionota bacterium]